MTETRDWRNAKTPQWVKEAVQAEIDQWRFTAALSWPTETKPEPLPFQWREYDLLTGDPQPGRYWAVPAMSRLEMFDLARADDIRENDATNFQGSSWKPWAFRTNGEGCWHTAAMRGPLFANERDARLYRRWLMCEDFARKLMEAV